MAAAAKSEIERAAPVFSSYHPTLHVLVEVHEGGQGAQVGRFHVVCVKHHRSVTVPAFADAVEQAHTPDVWCLGCQGTVERARTALDAARDQRALEALRQRLMGRL